MDGSAVVVIENVDSIASVGRTGFVVDPGVRTTSIEQQREAFVVVGGRVDDRDVEVEDGL